MRIEYRLPGPADNVNITAHATDDAVEAPVLCVYTPEAVAGARRIFVGRFKAVGAGGRVEEAAVFFDLRRAEFIIQPKKIVAEGFNFDKLPEKEPETSTESVKP